MYKCKCGYESSTMDYCEKCNKLLTCDCSDINQGRIKDIEIPFENGGRAITIQYKICDTCGKLFDVSINKKFNFITKTGKM